MAMATSPADRDDELLIAFTTAVNRSRARLKPALEAMGITAPQADALWMLDPAGGTPTMKDLAGRLNCDPSTATFLVDRLAAQGLVDRVTSATDRRSKCVSLTGKGLKVRNDLMRAMSEHSVLASLSATDQIAVGRLLRKALAKADD